MDPRESSCQIPLTQNPPPKSTGFGPGPRASASQWSSAPKRPNALLRPPRPPPLPPLSLPSPGTLKPIPAKKEVLGPNGATETRSARALNTCEERHLRANGGPPGLSRAHPLGAQCFTAAGTSVPARPASYRRARRLLISMAPAPPPPPAAAAAAAAAVAVAVTAAGGRETTSSGLHRHVRRAANCIVGGKGKGGGAEGEGRGRRGKEKKKGGPAKGRESKETESWGRRAGGREG